MDTDSGRTPTEVITCVESIAFKLPAKTEGPNIFQIVEHIGGFNGWKSVISRSPNDGTGISVLTNFELGTWPMRIILYKLYDKLFTLEEIDWDSRYASHTHV